MVHEKWRTCSLVVSKKQRYSIKSQSLLKLAQKQPRFQPDRIAMVPIEAMAKLRMCNMDDRTKKNRTKVWRKITLSYLELQHESMRRRMRAIGQVKEG